MNKRDLNNIQILCNYIEGKASEEEAMSSLTLKQTTEGGRKRYIKKLITIIKDEEEVVKARRATNG